MDDFRGVVFDILFEIREFLEPLDVLKLNKHEKVKY